MDPVENGGEYQTSIDGITHTRLDREDPKVEKEDRTFCKAHCWSLEDVLSEDELPFMSMSVQRDCPGGTNPQI